MTLLRLNHHPLKKYGTVGSFLPQSTTPVMSPSG
jgi:hypothetical protein